MKKMFYAAIIGGFFMLFGVFYACKEGVNPSFPTLTAEALAADSDFKNFVILSNERKKGLIFLNPENTKADKQKYLAEAKRLESEWLKDQSNTSHQLALLQMLGYNSIKEYEDKAKPFLESLKQVHEKYPNLRTMERKELNTLMEQTFLLLKSELRYKVYPNHHGIASVYNIDDLLRNKGSNLRGLTPEQEEACCNAVWSRVQTCYHSADGWHLAGTITCSITCAPLLPELPFALLCLFTCEVANEIAYGANLDECNGDAAANAHEWGCPDCFPK